MSRQKLIAWGIIGGVIIGFPITRVLHLDRLIVVEILSWVALLIPAIDALFTAGVHEKLTKED